LRETDLSVDQQNYNFNLSPYHYVTLNRKQLYVFCEKIVILIFLIIDYITIGSDIYRAITRNNVVAVVPIGCNRNARIVRSEPWIDSRTTLQRAAALISAWLRR